MQVNTLSSIACHIETQTPLYIGLIYNNNYNNDNVCPPECTSYNVLYFHDLNPLLQR